jgi:hypothetical protein
VRHHRRPRPRPPRRGPHAGAPPASPARIRVPPRRGVPTRRQ